MEVNTNGAAAKVTFFDRLGQKGTPWHFWEDKSMLTGGPKKSLCQKENMKFAATPLVLSPLVITVVVINNSCMIIISITINIIIMTIISSSSNSSTIITIIICSRSSSMQQLTPFVPFRCPGRGTRRSAASAGSPLVLLLSS